MGRCADALKVLYFVLACGLAAGLAAAIADLEFGGDGERQVMDFVEGLLTVILIVGAPVLVMGLIIHVMLLVTLAVRPDIQPNQSEQRVS